MKKTRLRLLRVVRKKLANHYITIARGIFKGILANMIDLSHYVIFRYTPYHKKV